MATLDEIAFIVYNDLNGGFGGSNERIALDQIKAEIHAMRGRVMGELAAKSTVLDAALYSTFNALKLEQVDFSGNEDVPSAKLVWYTRIPRLFDARGKRFVQYVTSIDRQTRYRVRFGLENNYWMHETYTAKQPTAVIEENGLYLFNHKGDYVSIRAIVDNPAEFDSQDGFACHDGDTATRYPVSQEILDMITGKVLEGKIRNAVRIRPDLINTQTDKN